MNITIDELSLVQLKDLLLKQYGINFLETFEYVLLTCEQNLMTNTFILNLDSVFKTGYKQIPIYYIELVEYPETSNLIEDVSENITIKMIDWIFQLKPSLKLRSKKEKDTFFKVLFVAFVFVSNQNEKN